MAEENSNGSTPDTSANGEASNVNESNQQELTQQLDKWKNDFLYLRAELDNVKKNHLKERSDLIKYGPERLIVSLLEVVDNLERALQTPFTPDNVETLKAGFELINKELLSSLERFGVRGDNPEGKPFDPNTHEALGSEPSDIIAEGHIVRTFKKSYRMYDKLIRPAQVVVATKVKPAE